MDGEGCFGTKKTTTTHTGRVELHTCFPDVAKKLYEKFGGCFMFKGSKNPKHRSSFHWAISGDSMREFIDWICPYLIEKLDQAILVNELHLYPPNSPERERIANRLKELKRIKYD